MKSLMVALVACLTLAMAKTAMADPSLGPAMFATFNNYNASDEKPGDPAYCRNEPSAMPSGRQTDCSVSMARTGTGRYTITVTNGAPFEEFFETGHTVFVTAVGSNALCREVGASVPTGTNDFVSNVRCVTPSGA